MHGKSYPVTLWLHRIAAQLSEMPLRLRPNAEMLESASRDHSANKFWPFTSGTKHQTGPFQKEPVEKCGNPKFGMCGPGDDCWKWVCGDCLSHRGCWEHDC